jgi:hypothetical protein
METFETTIVQGAAKQVTGIMVPAEVVAALGPRKNPSVRVTLNGFTYRSTVATMGGRFMVPLSAENRRAADLQGNETLAVTIELDLEPRTVEIPHDLRQELTGARVLDAFERCSPSRKKEYVRLLTSAKAPETRKRRITKIVGELK